MMVSDIDALVYISDMRAAKYDPNAGSAFQIAGGSPPVVLISAKYPVRHAPNIIADRPLGWQRPARFYSPKYESAASKKAFEPMRATLHWEPRLRFENGQATFEFYTSDHQVPYRFTLEGITDEGRPVSTSLTVF